MERDGGRTGIVVGTCSQTRPAKTCPWRGVISCRAAWLPVAPAAPRGPIAHSQGSCRPWEPDPSACHCQGRLWWQYPGGGDPACGCPGLRGWGSSQRCRWGGCSTSLGLAAHLLQDPHEMLCAKRAGLGHINAV